MIRFTRSTVIGASLVLAATLGLVAPAYASGHHDHPRQHGTLLQADLIGSLTTDAPLFGVNPGGVDWTVSSSAVKVGRDGRFDAKVHSLLVTSTQSNPVTTISASLVCNGALVDSVEPVPFDTAGNARIKGTFEVPDRCLAPAVLLHPANRVGTYIAARGVA